MRIVDLEALTDDLLSNTDWYERERYRTDTSRVYQLQLVLGECYVGAVVYVTGALDMHCFANGRQIVIPYEAWSEFIDILKRHMTEQLTERTE